MSGVRLKGKREVHRLMNSKKHIKRICFVVLLIALFIDTAVAGLFAWFQDSYGVTFREIIYTIKSPLAGANSSFFLGAVRYVAPKMAAFVIVLFIAVILFFVMEKYVAVDLFLRSRSGREKKVNVIGIAAALLFAAVVFYSVKIISDINSRLQISQFIRDYTARTEIYEDYYVMPDVDKISSDNPKNLIYIYMESMETTYASKDVGGEQPAINYIPNLTKLAEDNISFSDEEGLGGFISAKDTDWTMSAIWATQTGAAFNFPIEGNSDFGNQEHFAKNTVTLGDILNQKGYYQDYRFSSCKRRIFTAQMLLLLSHKTPLYPAHHRAFPAFPYLREPSSFPVSQETICRTDRFLPPWFQLRFDCFHQACLNHPTDTPQTIKARAPLSITRLGFFLFSYWYSPFAFYRLSISCRILLLTSFATENNDSDAWLLIKARSSSRCVEYITWHKNRGVEPLCM